MTVVSNTTVEELTEIRAQSFMVVALLMPEALIQFSVIPDNTATHPQTPEGS